MSQLTAHFNLAEFAVSADYPELAAQIKFTETDKLKLYYLCATILEPVRGKFGAVKPLSGKRIPELNEAVGGAVHSDHLYEFVSCAVDFTTLNASVYGCWWWVQKNLNPSAWGQLIYYPTREFIHVSLPTPKHHGEVLEL